MSLFKMGSYQKNGGLIIFRYPIICAQGVIAINWKSQYLLFVSILKIFLVHINRGRVAVECHFISTNLL